MKEYSFNTAYTQAQDLYGLELNPVDFENIGLIGWDKIGNTRHRLYKYIVEPSVADDDSYYIELPCNCDIIEAVTADYEDYQKTSPTYLAGDNQSGWVEGYVESRKFNTNHLYSSGKFIKYIREGQIIYLADRFDSVNILYKGIIADDEGLPSLNEKELDAIAAFLAYSDMYKKALKTKDQSTFQLAQSLEQKWLTKCTQARVPDYINQNEMDEILNAATSWDRKRFGKSFKPVR
jgi:hypothetical protein